MKSLITCGNNNNVGGGDRGGHERTEIIAYVPALDVRKPFQRTAIRWCSVGGCSVGWNDDDDATDARQKKWKFSDQKILSSDSEEERQWKL